MQQAKRALFRIQAKNIAIGCIKQNPHNRLLIYSVKPATLGLKAFLQVKAKQSSLNAHIKPLAATCSSADISFVFGNPKQQYKNTLKMKYTKRTYNTHNYKKLRHVDRIFLQINQHRNAKQTKH